MLKLIKFPTEFHTKNMRFVGIPGTPELAETYYSQFDDEFEIEDDIEDDGSDSDSNEGTLLSTVKGPKIANVHNEDVDSKGDEEMRVFITCMQNALDKNDTCEYYLSCIYTSAFNFI